MPSFRILQAALLVLAAGSAAAETPNPPPAPPQPPPAPQQPQPPPPPPVVQQPQPPQPPPAAEQPPPPPAPAAPLPAMPTSSFAEVLPASTILFFEIPNAKSTVAKMKDTPLGRFWDSQAMQKFYEDHYNGQLPDEQEVLDAIRAIPKQAEGKAMFAVGAPETVDAGEIESPLVYALETKQSAQLETLIRQMLDALDEGIKNPRTYGPFSVQESGAEQTLFLPQGAIHARTQKAMDSFLDGFVKRPEKPLDPLLKDVRALLPNADAILRVNRNDFQTLMNAGVLVEEDDIAALDSLGLVQGTVWEEAAGLNADGVEEHARLMIGSGDAKPPGIFAVLKDMGADIPPPPPAGQPLALDAIPWQAGILASFQGDAAKNAVALAEAFRAIDLLTGPAPEQPAAKPPAAQPPPAQAPAGKLEVKAGGAEQKPQTAGREALADIAKNIADKKDDKKDGAAPAADPPPAPLASGWHIAKIEKCGLRLEQLLAQTEGPIQLAIFPHQLQPKEPPDDLPLSPLFAAVLKDPASVERALDAASIGAGAHFNKETLNGGTHYIEADALAGTRPGFWLKGKYLLFAKDRELIELAGAALLHQDGNERIADRASYKKALAANQLNPGALLTVYGDPDQVIEMPYKLAQINWEEEEMTPFPDYEIIRALLAGKPCFLQVKAIPGGLQVDAQTPLSLPGMIEAFRRTMKEAGPF